MGSSQRTIDFLLEQTVGAGEMTARKMFGEYALYCDGKVVAFVCDDQLFLKPTAAGEAALGTPTLGKPYPGAKDYFLIEDERWEEPEWLADLIRTTADALPLPAPKKPRARKAQR